MREEKWVKVLRDDRYSVSDQGDIRNDKTGRIMKWSTNNGRPVINLRGWITTPARVVYESFHGNWLSSTDRVRHYDGNLFNCALNNLYRDVKEMPTYEATYDNMVGLANLLISIQKEVERLASRNNPEGGTEFNGETAQTIRGLQGMLEDMRNANKALDEIEERQRNDELRDF